MNLVMRDSLMVFAVAHWLSYHRGVVLGVVSSSAWPCIGVV